ncbi:MAG: hypothetical protein CMJ75_13200 [Planctomycetaceae bacterium]|nr:hypothetical protein [Planctomycetaceae bacterium]
MAKKPDPYKQYKKYSRLAKRPTGKAAIRFYLSLPFTVVGQTIKNWFTGRLSTRASWALELTFVALVCLLAVWLNFRLQLDADVEGPLWLRRCWLGAMVALVYLTGRLTWFVAKLFPRTLSQFPDIHAAFDLIRMNANAADVSLETTPLFLLLGTNRSSDNAAATSSFIADSLDVSEADLPVHTRGDNEAVWLSLPGVSALSQQVDRWQTAEKLGNAGKRSFDANAIRLTNAAKAECFQRMLYFGQQLRVLRGGVIPVNGIVIVVPLEWVLNPECAGFLEALKIDQVALQRALGVKCECLLVFEGIEQFPEFQSYMDQFPDSARQRRCGCTLPAFSQLASSDFADLHQWLCRFFRQQVYGFLASSGSSSSNGGLYRFLDLIKQMQHGFSRLMVNLYPDDTSESLYLGGVYFSALHDGTRTFFDGVAAKLTSSHDDVIGWSPSSLGRDRRLGIVAKTLATVSVVILFVDVALLLKLIW